MLRVATGWVVLALGVASGVEAQQPRVLRAQVRTADAGAGLGAVVEQIAGRGEPAWIAWQVEAVRASAGGCCWTDGCEGCRLEGTPTDRPAPAAADTSRVPPASGPVALEGESALLVLARVEGGRLVRLRTVHAGCELDAGGLPFHVLTNVAAADSLAWLEAQARRPPETADRDPIARTAVHALARHRAAGADAALDRLIAVPAVRRHVVAALALARGAPGLARLERLVRETPPGADGRHAVSSIALSPDPRAPALLLDLARNHPDARVRADALVGAARLAGRDTAAALSEAVARDPDTEVKRKAVFGISRLPDGEGVPLLIEVARRHANPEIRRTAMFWLGQSKDPRAVDFFASLLK